MQLSGALENSWAWLFFTFFNQKLGAI